MTQRRIALFLIIVLGFALSVGAHEASNHPKLSFLRDPDLWLATGVNLMGIGLFTSRVHAPEAARWFGYGTQMLGIPALTLGLLDVMRGSADLSTFANFGYAAWALGAAVVDHVLNIEYRDPVNPAILIPYVATYYLAIGAQAAVLLDEGIGPWAIAGTACLVNVAASFYARAHEAD